MFEFLNSLLHRKSRYISSTTGDEKEVYQYSTIASLIEGVYEGTVTYGELQAHGDFGLGTFDRLDGEMVALDGQFYQIRQDGKLYRVTSDQKTPFAVLVHFRPDTKLRLEQPCSYAEFQEFLNSNLLSSNFIYAIRADAIFDRVNVRVVPKQHRPYLPMTQAAKTQIEFQYANTEGTICGFRFPKYTSNLNVPGYHTHFVSKDRSVGGHVLDARMRKLDIQIEQLSGFHIQLPSHGQFLSADLNEDKSAEIEEVENKRRI
jgi:acetolactate decarboxylase